MSAMHGPHLDARKAHITGNEAQGTSAPGDPWYALSAQGVTACGRVAGSDTPTILGFASLCSLEQFLHGHHSNVQLTIACSGPGVGWLGELIQNLGYIQDAWISIADDKYWRSSWPNLSSLIHFVWPQTIFSKHIIFRLPGFYIFSLSH